jgi:hypothetical protein
VAAVIKDATSADVDVVEGARGEFSIRVGDRVVAQKSPRGFPSDDEIVAGVRGALQQ